MNPAILSMIPAGINAATSIMGLLDVGGNRQRKNKLNNRKN